MKVSYEVKSQYPRFNDFEKFSRHLWSDGCASQFRFRFMFHLKALFPQSYQVISYYNDRNHGESLMEVYEAALRIWFFVQCYRKKL